MTKKGLGAVIREARTERGLTQRKLAILVAVKASHIAYIESNRRRPSLPLLRRIARTLDLNPRELLFLAHPDAKAMVGELSPARAKTAPDPWRQFLSNRGIHRRHKITLAEIRVLKQVSLLQHVSCPSHFVYILLSIRQAAACV